MRGALLAQPPRGAELLPSSGAVTNAAYLYPTAVIHLRQWLDVRTGAVIAVSTSDFVDPVRSTIYGTAQNYRGGSSLARDLGVELDLGIMGRNTLPGGIKFVWGLQGATLFPGHAWDDGSAAAAVRLMRNAPRVRVFRNDMVGARGVCWRESPTQAVMRLAALER